MRRSFVGSILLVAALAGGCSPGPTGSASTGADPSASQSALPLPSTSPPRRVPLPRGFPIVPGAVAAPLPDDDPGLIGLWTSDQPGSTAYDFLLGALPAAGYPIRGAYPGDTVAQFLFSTPSGATWQIDLSTTPSLTTRIEVRLPRP